MYIYYLSNTPQAPTPPYLKLSHKTLCTAFLQESYYFSQHLLPQLFSMNEVYSVFPARKSDFLKKYISLIPLQDPDRFWATSEAYSKLQIYFVRIRNTSPLEGTFRGPSAMCTMATSSAGQPVGLGSHRRLSSDLHNGAEDALAQKGCAI